MIPLEYTVYDKIKCSFVHFPVPSAALHRIQFFYLLSMEIDMYDQVLLIVVSVLFPLFQATGQPAGI
jgi:hypothetical protein